jgi:glycosyltransferase 2 family protein
MQVTKRKVYAIARWAFFAVSILYLAHFANGALEDGISVSAPAPRLWVLTATSAAVFSLTALFLVLGWHALLVHLALRRPLGATARVFCITQIAKYLPGNVGHHVGRVALAKLSLGIPSASTAITIAQESALVCLAALLVGATSYLLQPTLTLPAPIAGVDFRAVLTMVIAVGLLALALVNHVRNSEVRPNPALTWLFRITPSWPAVSAALPFYVATYLINGLAAFVIASAIMPVHLPDLALLTGAYALAWMVGFLVPGAPGGLGVRESALVLLLGNVYPADTVLAISLLSRLATVAADLIIFTAGTLLPRVKHDTHASR